MSEGFCSLNSSPHSWIFYFRLCEFQSRSTNTSRDARPDIKAGGFWTRGVTAVFDARVTHINSCSNLVNKSTFTIFKKQEQRKYQQSLKSGTTITGFICMTMQAMTFSIAKAIYYYVLRIRTENLITGHLNYFVYNSSRKSKQAEIYRKPCISPSKYKPPNSVTQKPFR